MTNTIDFKAYLAQRSAAVEKMLRCEVAKMDKAPRQIVEAMEYSLLAGGKRLRPVMLLEAAKVCGLTEEKEAVPFACALEMIHTSSLIHDDLPAMDNDDFRRGRPTNHKVYGEAMAILAGDALLNHANEIMAHYTALHCENRFAQAAYTITSATGITGMIGGQTIDVLSEQTSLTIDSEPLLRKIHTMKTCALIRAAVVAGAQIAQASESLICQWEAYAQALGLAFQITDDILDVTGNPEVLGKPTGSDLHNQKATFVTLLGLEKAQAAADEETNKAVSAAEKIPNADFFIWLAKYLSRRDK